MSDVLAEALRYASIGWRVIPIRPRAKVPPMRSWQTVATTGTASINKWWKRQYLGHGVGIATGQESGVWVLDVDPGNDGLINLSNLVAEHGSLPKGPKALTPSGGIHLFFRNPSGLHVATTKNVAGAGLDVRGDGGQVVAAPTGHPLDACKLCQAGRDHDLRPYMWADGRSPWEIGLPDAPEWLLDLVVPERAAPPPTPPPPAERLSLPVDTIGGSAAAEMTSAHDWHRLLERDGWQPAGNAPGGDTFWTRPGKSVAQGVSAVLHEPDGPFVNYSTSVPALCQTWARSPKGDGWAYSIFGYIAATGFDGDRSAAARDWHTRKVQNQHDDWVATSGGVQPGQLSPDSPASTDDDFAFDAAFAHLIDWGSFWQQDHSQQEWEIWPLVPKGRAVALFAPAKAGKSTVTLAAVAAAAVGDRVFGQWQPPEPVDVLYMDYEMTEADIWERLNELGYGPETDLSHLHYALLPSVAPLDTDRGAMQVVMLAQHVGAKVVVIDTFSRAVQGDENDSDTFRDFYRHTGMALKSRGIACLRTDHAGKDIDRGQRGSSAKNDDVDLVWALERSDTGVSIYRTHSRVTWVPEKIEIDQIEHDDGEVVYRIADRRQYPQGTKELAQLLDRLGVPLDASARQAAKMLREAGESAKNERIRLAQQYRTSHEIAAWSTATRSDADEDDLA